MRIFKVNAALIQRITAQRRLQLNSKEQAPKQELVTSPEEARAAKINELQQKVQSGAYQIDFDKLAQKILDKEISS